MSTGIITTIAGSSTSGSYSGDNGAATSAALNGPNGIELDSSGSFLFNYFTSRCITFHSTRQRVHR